MNNNTIGEQARIVLESMTDAGLNSSTLANSRGLEEAVESVPPANPMLGLGVFLRIGAVGHEWQRLCFFGAAALVGDEVVLRRRRLPLARW